MRHESPWTALRLGANDARVSSGRKREPCTTVVWRPVSNAGVVFDLAGRPVERAQWHLYLSRPRRRHAHNEKVTDRVLYSEVGAAAAAALARLWARAEARRRGEPMPARVDESAVEALRARLAEEGATAVLGVGGNEPVVGCFAPNRGSMTGRSRDGPCQWYLGRPSALGSGPGERGAPVPRGGSRRRRIRHCPALRPRNEHSRSLAVRAPRVATCPRWRTPSGWPAGRLREAARD